MWPTWGPPGFCRCQVGPMLAPWTSLSGMAHLWGRGMECLFYVWFMFCCCMYHHDKLDNVVMALNCNMLGSCNMTWLDGILPKGPYPPCLRMADRALLAGYPWCIHFSYSQVSFVVANGLLPMWPHWISYHYDGVDWSGHIRSIANMLSFHLQQLMKLFHSGVDILCSWAHLHIAWIWILWVP